MSKKRVTNKKFMNDGFFKKCCDEADIKPTVRQASKFRNHKGLAYKYRKKVKDNT